MNTRSAGKRHVPGGVMAGALWIAAGAGWTSHVPPAAPSDPVAAPDFGGAICGEKMSTRAGRVPLLTILWDPHRPEHPAPPAAELDEKLYGSGPSVASWLSENSGGRFTIERAMPLAWRDADFKEDRYWGADPGDTDGNGFVTGHVEKWAEAVRKADENLDFAAFDTDHDGTLQPTELAVLVIIPQMGTFGTMRQPAGREVPAWEPLTVDGVVIPYVTEAYVGSPVNLGVLCHELAHLMLGAPDMYFSSAWTYAPGDLSIMDRSYTTTHLDPYEKLKLGWLTTTVVGGPGEFDLRDVERHNEALVLYDRARGPGEYFIVENRLRGTSFDAGAGAAGPGLAADGVAIWHVVEDPAIYGALTVPGVDPGDWGRRAVRLLRANGGNQWDDAGAVWNTPGVVRVGGSASLPWIDGTPSVFGIELLSGAGETVRIRVSVRTDVAPASQKQGASSTSLPSNTP
ncbi:MAG: hypothetical protein JNM07_01155 [Phycisphaerae bacterium]|nr:hypothetical protein [Phycisphaerae bacterium]